ncbi:hypothetical protein [Kribbella turkmenica]|uniref:hypothetical protein n=1 Tax=Kribbella turkmenica TaxID=2530375 RepID=UPI00192D4DB2|nr:hypothetical protein [Kribbella turkmenica]
MDVAVLLVFAFFTTAVAVATMTRTEVLRASVRRPRLFQGAVLGAAAATVPVDLYAVVYGTIGPGGTRLTDVADRLLLLNVAAACGVAALHGCLRGRALAGSAPAATVAGAAAACSPGPGSGSRAEALPGPGSGSGGQTDDRHALRMGVLGWTGPLIALVVVTAVVALGSGSASGGNGTGAGGVGATAGSALAIYSLLVCLISASLFRGRPARVPGTRAGTPGSAIDPREG